MLYHEKSGKSVPSGFLNFLLYPFYNKMLNVLKFCKLIARVKKDGAGDGFCVTYIFYRKKLFLESLSNHDGAVSSAMEPKSAFQTDFFQCCPKLCKVFIYIHIFAYLKFTSLINLSKYSCKWQQCNVSSPKMCLPVQSLYIFLLIWYLLH
jgi:hypothetical protein